MKNLGKKAKDKITGFEGIIVGKCTYLFGCATYGIAPAVIKEGKVESTVWFDEGRIEVTGKGVSKESVSVDKPGGDNPDIPMTTH
jgi:hypothetical protein